MYDLFETNYLDYPRSVKIATGSEIDLDISANKNCDSTYVIVIGKRLPNSNFYECVMTKQLDELNWTPDIFNSESMRSFGVILVTENMASLENTRELPSGNYNCIIERLPGKTSGYYYNIYSEQFEGEEDFLVIENDLATWHSSQTGSDNPIIIVNPTIPDIGGGGTPGKDPGEISAP